MESLLSYVPYPIIIALVVVLSIIAKNVYKEFRDRFETLEKNQESMKRNLAVNKQLKETLASLDHTLDKQNDTLQHHSVILGQLTTALDILTNKLMEK